MVLSLKAWESRSPPGLPRTAEVSSITKPKTPAAKAPGVLSFRGKKKGQGRRSV
jgi:hypothetical protein